MKAVLKLSSLAAVVTAVSCAATDPLHPPDLPVPLQPPVSEVMHYRTQATGVQVYECAPAGNGFAWTFQAPEADLFGPDGRRMGRHYGGPTWHADDGSLVQGTVKSRAEAPGGHAIPWLRLVSRGNGGHGIFSATSTILRVDTVGGNPPATPCDAGERGRVARVPYTATYFFYRPAA